MPTVMMQRSNLANAFVQVNDPATEKALAEAKAQVGETAWKAGYSKETERVAREALKAHGVRYETELKGTLERVELAETQVNGAPRKKLRVTLAQKNGDKLILSSDTSSEFSQRLIAKLDRTKPGQTVTIGGFAEPVERNGKSFVNHVATLKDARGQEITANPEHNKQATEKAQAAQEPLKAAGITAKATLDTVGKSAREAYFAGVAQSIAGRFPELEQKKPTPRLEAHLQTDDKTWHSVGLWVEADGAVKGILSKVNKEAGINDKQQITFTEQAKPGKCWIAHQKLSDGTTQHVKIVAGQNAAGEPVLAARFGERDKNGKYILAKGRGGLLKPNEALLAQGEKSKTAELVKAKYGVDIAGKQKAKELQR